MVNTNIDGDYKSVTLGSVLAGCNYISFMRTSVSESLFGRKKNKSIRSISVFILVKMAMEATILLVVLGKGDTRKANEPSKEMETHQIIK